MLSARPSLNDSKHHTRLPHYTLYVLYGAQDGVRVAKLGACVDNAPQALWAPLFRYEVLVWLWLGLWLWAAMDRRRSICSTFVTQALRMYTPYMYSVHAWILGLHLWQGSLRLANRPAAVKGLISIEYGELRTHSPNHTVSRTEDYAEYIRSASYSIRYGVRVEYSTLLEHVRGTSYICIYIHKLELWRFNISLPMYQATTPYRVTVQLLEKKQIHHR